MTEKPKTDEQLRREKAMQRMGQAIGLHNDGDLGATLRLRAEVLLTYIGEGDVRATAAQRERLERIAIAPGNIEDDKAFLGSFDDQLGGDE
jgi:hypothetical protein